MRHRGHGRRRDAPAAELRVDPDALHLGGPVGDDGQLGLEDDPVAVEPCVGALALDQLDDAPAVAAAAVVEQRGDADLLGVHRHGGREELVDLAGPDQADGRVGGDHRLAVGDQQRLVFPYVAGASPVAAEPVPQIEHRVGPADDR